MNLTRRIRDLAHAGGFDLFGVASPEPLEQERDRLVSWLNRGLAGQMQYIARNVEKRIDPSQVLPSVQSILCLGISYYYSEPSLRAKGEALPSSKSLDCFVAQDAPGNAIEAKIARYAWGKDYHKVLKKKLKKLMEKIVVLAGPQTECKEYTDTGPLMERQLAARAGLGFPGKNTLLLHPRHGSYFFLAEILTNLKLEYGRPTSGSCGSCRACLDACPTQAFTKAHELDATRCISYWTIEARGDIPKEFHEAIGDHAFGCDICQEVCPFNRRPLPSGCEEFAPSQGAGPSLDLETVLRMDEASFGETFAHTPLTRAKHSGIIRNAQIVRKNLCSPAS